MKAQAVDLSVRWAAVLKTLALRRAKRTTATMHMITLTMAAICEIRQAPHLPVLYAL
jgi:hypothetical protein